jgi:hypothetical protein
LGGGASGIVAVVAFPDVTNLIKGLVAFGSVPTLRSIVCSICISISINRSLSISIRKVRWSATDVCLAGQIRCPVQLSR